MKVKSIVSLFVIKNYNAKQISCGCLWLWGKKHLEHCEKHQATYNSQSFFWGLENDKQSLWDQMFMNVVILIKIFLIPAGLIRGFPPRPPPLVFLPELQQLSLIKILAICLPKMRDNRVHRFWKGNNYSILGCTTQLECKSCCHIHKACSLSDI